MTLQDIAYMRLRSQYISDTNATSPVDVVRHLGAVQAQDYGQALWAIGLRTKGATRQTVEKAIADGEILRTWPMRGTIHFVPSEDAAWMLSISSARIIARTKGRRAGLGLTDAVLQKAEHTIDKTIQGRRFATRQELLSAFGASGLDVSDQRGAHMLLYWSLRGKLCIGPMHGKQQTYALLSTWAPNQRSLSREEGIIELARRYFISHGPATLADFSTWASVLKSEARQALLHLTSELESATVDGAEYWFAPQHAATISQEARGTYLLAGFEEYLLGYKDRSAVIAPEFTAAPNKNGIFFPIIVVDGQVVGTWKRVVGPKKISITFEPFVPLSPAVLTACQLKAQAYGEFMQLPIAILG